MRLVPLLVEQVGRDRQIMMAVGGDLEAPLCIQADLFAKYAVAFPKMSRSIFTRGNTRECSEEKLSRL